MRRATQRYHSGTASRACGGRSWPLPAVGANGFSPRSSENSLSSFATGSFCSSRYGRQAVQANSTPTASSILSTGNRTFATPQWLRFQFSEKSERSKASKRPSSGAARQRYRLLPRMPIEWAHLDAPSFVGRLQASSAAFLPTSPTRPTFLDYRNSSSPKGLSGQRLAKFRVALLATARVGSEFKGHSFTGAILSTLSALGLQDSDIRNFVGKLSQKNIDARYRKPVERIIPSLPLQRVHPEPRFYRSISLLRFPQRTN